ncbi:uracil-DNA glycosylase [Deinococcus sp. Arct2-2]|uniref:uracil-DNA glycosylase n=1 Tax=Deinococcus sp. Arct2-2 TaxID=2568653 RepID=UPI0010A4CA17|nr:uracil-DNA glycosylase [Deinococcus sp. Arct2-2]THF69697.1 uracil-DNA glycosylase [Deinococcus sp. Arct2-2]
MPPVHAPLQVVWFKKDLRVHDHLPLLEAAARGPVLPLYIYEPEQLQHPEFGGHHLQYLNDCLTELGGALQALGTPLVCRAGEAVEVLSALHAETGIAALWAHEETGNGVSYARDRRVRAWCRAGGIPFTELPQNGVVRRLHSRDGWAALWEERMGASPLKPPVQLPAVSVPSVGLLEPADARVAPNHKSLPPGGRPAAKRTLDSFLAVRGVDYMREMSSPLTAEASCSRLSAPLAFGTVSLREVVQATRQRLAAVKGDPEADPSWVRSLRSFESRLHWHCHFMQRLETEPDMEFRNLNRAFDDLRPQGARDSFDRWAAGQTGYPLQDACMRMLNETGWLNFRMRAMTISFSSQLLWLHWRVPGEYLAHHWLDNEPGIHWAQVQMQSSTVGINQVRIYNPTKQARDQDPTGEFIRRWVPELAEVPTDFIHAPWTWSGAGRLKYPAPIVDAERAMRAAKAKIMAARQTGFFQEEARRVYELHGSRKKAVMRAERRANGLPEKPVRRTQAVLDMAGQPSLFGGKTATAPPIVPAGLPESWREALAPEFAAPSFHQLKDFLIEERRTHRVYPPAPDVFNALRWTPLEQVKVLILGQDPYHGAGQAHGLSFSVQPGVRIPPSLHNIFKELHTDVPDVLPPQHGDLSAWAQQGVLLLNAVLTVRAGQPNSHAGMGWEPLTDAVIRVVNAKPERVVFVLWGAYARKKARLITGPQHVTIQSGHPSPLSVAHFTGTRPFSRVNAALEEVNIAPIDWQLPAGL